LPADSWRGKFAVPTDEKKKRLSVRVGEIRVLVTKPTIAALSYWQHARLKPFSVSRFGHGSGAPFPRFGQSPESESTSSRLRRSANFSTCNARRGDEVMFAKLSNHERRSP
jgi:hypothetical protein